MGAKTIELREEVYAELKARKREDESFNDLVTRLLEAAAVDWRDSFGTLPEADKLEALAERSREQLGAGMADRQQEALEALAGDDDETA